MSNKDVLLFASLIMGFAAALHIIRVLVGWDLVMGAWNVPVWFSILAFLIAGFLSYKVFRISKKLV